MGNTSSSTGSPMKSCTGSGKKSRGGSSSKNGTSGNAAETATERAKKVFGEVQESLKISVKKLEEQDHPAAHLIDTVCGPIFDSRDNGRHNRKMRENRSASFYSEDVDSDDDRTISEDEQTLDTDFNQSTVNGSTAPSSAVPPKAKKEHMSSMDSSYLSQSDYESEVGGNQDRTSKRKKSKRRSSHDDPSINSEDEDSKQTNDTATTPGQAPAQLLSKPLASSFAKRCYFTKAGIGKTTQHYEGLTLTGNVVLMLAAAMKLKGCPTICDEDLRRVEQTYPNQFSRLPDELLLSSGWRRISKYCHFSNKPIPDGIPFFHSKQRLHPQGGYYFLLAAAVGMVRPIDVEPLTRDTLVLLETDYPSQCDAAPEVLIQDPDEWILVDKFCFFSGGPINTEEDVYYQADFDGNPIYMLAFLSPSLTPEELYKLDGTAQDEHGNPIPGLNSVAAVQDVESVYDLTERDFHDLKLYHLGPCRALPQYILQPQAWTKVLPPHFLEARHRAILRAQDFEMANGGPVTPLHQDPMPNKPQLQHMDYPNQNGGFQPPPFDEPMDHSPHNHPHHSQAPQDEDYYHNQQPPQDGQGGFNAEYTAMGMNHSNQFHDNNHYPQDPQQQLFHHEQQQQYNNHPSPRNLASPHNMHSPPQQQPQPYHQQHQQEDEFQREVDEEGAFADSHAAPLDEAMATRKASGPPGVSAAMQQHQIQHRMDPPEQMPPDPEVDGSVLEEHNPHIISNASGSYYSNTQEISKDNSHYSNAMDSPGQAEAAPQYDEDGMPQYGYSFSPGEKGDDGYYHQDQSRDDQYYDSPDGLQNQPGSQDHEFFNAPSGGGEDDEDYEPSNASSFDHQGHMGRHPDDHLQGHMARHPDDHLGPMGHPDDDYMGHPDDHQYGNYYGEEEEPDARLELQESSSAEYFRGDASPSPIKTDRLRQLGRKKQVQSPASAMASPQSQASSVSEYSHSSAMRGAQELLKRNRQRRHEQARRQQANAEVRNTESVDDNSPVKSATQYAFSPDQSYNGSPSHPRVDDGSASAWESEGSEALTSVISGSSVWTDTSSNPADRSSRRALILQMAKARMKSNKERDPAEKTIKEEKSGGDDTNDDYGDDHSEVRPQGLNDVTTATDLDFAADLD